MELENWSTYYKTHETELTPTTTQMCYEPKVSPDGSVFCMDFTYPSDYQRNQQRLSYTKEHVDRMFEREVKYLTVFKDKSYSPEILDITDNRIFIKWYGHTLNDCVYKHKDLAFKHPNWYYDLREIILDQVNEGYLKCTLYPHSHYYDNEGKMRTIDFYATVEKDNPVLTVRELEGLIGLETTRFTQATENDKINVEQIFKSGLLEYSKWPINLVNIHNKIYGK